MKTLLALICCLIAFTAVAKENYTPPETLNDVEIRQAKTEMKKNQATLKDYWQNRLAMAKTNDEKLAKSNVGLKKPYYGDYKHAH